MKCNTFVHSLVFAHAYLFSITQIWLFWIHALCGFLLGCWTIGWLSVKLLWEKLLLMELPPVIDHPQIAHKYIFAMILVSTFIACESVLFLPPTITMVATNLVCGPPRFVKNNKLFVQYGYFNSWSRWIILFFTVIYSILMEFSLEI